MAGSTPIGSARPGFPSSIAVLKARFTRASRSRAPFRPASRRCRSSRRACVRRSIHNSGSWPVPNPAARSLIPLQKQTPSVIACSMNEHRVHCGCSSGGSDMRSLVRLGFVVLSVVLVPSMVFAQASITGQVKDSSGAVLPGVTVEAASPALIEKVRSAVSDSSGQYRIEDLRPGTYTVTFSLTGFSVFKREGIELSGSFTAVVNAEMRLGALEETIVVTGESPIVDVQSARRRLTLGSDGIRSIPTIRNYNGVVLLVPGVVTNTNDVPTGATTTQFPIHGGLNNEGRLMIDGLNIGTPVGGNQPTGYITDIGNAQESTFTTSS